MINLASADQQALHCLVDDLEQPKNTARYVGSHTEHKSMDGVLAMMKGPKTRDEPPSVTSVPSSLPGAAENGGTLRAASVT